MRISNLTRIGWATLRALGIGLVAVALLVVSSDGLFGQAGGAGGAGGAAGGSAAGGASTGSSGTGAASGVGASGTAGATGTIGGTRTPGQSAGTGVGTLPAPGAVSRDLGGATPSGIGAAGSSLNAPRSIGAPNAIGGANATGAVNTNRAAAGTSAGANAAVGTPAVDPGLRGNLGADVGTFNDPARVGSGTLDAIGTGTLPSAANSAIRGMTPGVVNPAAAELLGFNFGTGAGSLVIDSVVPAGVGAVAGLLPGDQIVAINGRPIATRQDWMTFLAGAQPGTWNVLVRRGGEQVTIALPMNQAIGASGTAFNQSALGVRVNNSPAGGVAITDVRPGSPAVAAGLIAGDRLLSVGGVEVRTAEDVTKAIDARQVGQQTTLRILRGVQITDLTTALGEHQQLFGQPDAGAVRQAMRPEQPTPAGAAAGVPGPEREAVQEAIGVSPEAVEQAEEQLGRRADESQNRTASPTPAVPR